MSQNPRLTNNQTTTKTSLEATVNNTTTKAYYTIEDQLEVYGQNTYRYDDDGYLQEKTTPEGTTTYSYGTLGELKQVTTPTQSISYQHNANNQRVAKLINNQVVEKYLWADLTTLLAIYDSNDNLVQRFEYVNDRMPVAMTDSNGTKYYLHYDQVGSLKAVSDANGNIVKETTYDTFGNVLNDTNPSLKVPFGFAGGLYDSDTKLTRFGYRDYDATTGKWTAKDPIGFSGGDSNLYGYVLGDPVNFIDPEGLSGFAIVRPFAVPKTRIGIKPKERPKFIDPEPTQAECAAEWRAARIRCREELEKPNPDCGLTGGHKDINTCAAGLVSEKCGGNKVDWGDYS